MQPFISLQDLEEYLKTDLTECTALARIALDSACEIVRGYLDQDVNLGSESIRIDGNGCDALVLNDPPVRSVTSVTILSDDSDPDEVLGVMKARHAACC